MGLEIEIDREICMGSGNCQFWAPATFDLDDEGIAIVIDPEGDPEDKIIAAAQGWPTSGGSVYTWPRSTAVRARGSSSRRWCSRSWDARWRPDRSCRRRWRPR